MEHILSFLIFFPAVAALFGFIITKESIRAYAITVTAVEFLVSLLLWQGFDGSTPQMQFVEMVPLITNFGINYYLGVDGFSIFMIILSTFMTMIAIIGLSITDSLKNLTASLLVLLMTMIGVFAALDAILFYVFWELSLVPMLYIIGYWGSGKKIYAAVKFFLYTFTASLIMLVGMLVLAFMFYQATGKWSFSITDWHLLQLPVNLQFWLFIAMGIGFAVKVPMFPFHTWLPYAHGMAPTIGSVILAAVLLKMGTYGFVRFSLPLFPDASVAMMMPMAVIAIIMVIYTAMVAYAQEDMKQVIAYSSISHMGIIILGTFALNPEGIGGAVFFMLSHGVISGALFMLVGVIYDRRHTKLMSQMGGIASVMPAYATIFGFMVMASVGLPLTMGFVGEFLALVGFYKVSPVMTLLAGTSIILGAVYMLSLFKKSFFGEVTVEENKGLKDLNGRELTALVPLVIVVAWLGIYPKPVLGPIDIAAKNLNFMYYKAVSPETKAKLMEFNTIEKGGK